MPDQKPTGPVRTVFPVRPVNPVGPFHPGPLPPGPFRPLPPIDPRVFSPPQQHPPTLATQRPPFVPFSPMEMRLARAREDRLTPFLLLKLTPQDDGTRQSLQSAQVPETLFLSRDGEPHAGFQLHAGSTYSFSGRVSNLGESPALMGFASLYIIDGNVLTKTDANGKLLVYGQREPVVPFDMVDFTAAPESDTVLRFRRKWVAPALSTGISDRISVYLHVEDLSGDSSTFIADNGYQDRHTARIDYHLS